MSSIPAAYHFGRLAPYGLIANGLAFPVIGILVMPFRADLGHLLMPFGLEALPLTVMGEGLKLVLCDFGLGGRLSPAPMSWWPSPPP